MRPDQAEELIEPLRRIHRALCCVATETQEGALRVWEFTASTDREELE